jgi:hypothetical protein
MTVLSPAPENPLCRYKVCDQRCVGQYDFNLRLSEALFHPKIGSFRSQIVWLRAWYSFLTRADFCGKPVDRCADLLTIVSLNRFENVEQI